MVRRVVVLDDNGQRITVPAPAAGRALVGGADGSPTWGGFVDLTTTSVKTAAYNAAPGELVRVDIAAGSFPINLPPATSRWDIVVKVVTAAASLAATAANVTASAGDVINKAGTTAVPMRYLNQAKRFTSDGAGTITVTGGDFDLTVADARANATQPTSLSAVLNGLTNRVTPVAVWDASTLTGAQGDSVGILEDLAGQGNAVDAVGTQRPTLQAAALNGLNTLRFSTAQWMTTSAGLTNWDQPARAQPLTCFALVKMRAAGTSAAARTVMVSAGSGSNVGMAMQATVSSGSGYGSWFYPYAGAAAVGGGESMNDDTWHVVICRMNSTGFTVMVDGVVVASGVGQGQSTHSIGGRLVLGAFNVSGALPMDADFAEGGYLQGELNAKGCERLTEYLRAKWLYGPASTPRQDSVVYEDRVDGNGQAYRLFRTATLSSATPPLLVMNHHQGATATYLQPGAGAAGTPYNIARAAALAGWVVVWPNNYGDSWSNANGVLAGPAAEAAARTALGITGFSQIVLYGQSMGGLLAAVQAKLATFTAPVKGVFTVDSPLSLKWGYNSSGFKASMDTAYGIVSGTLSVAAAANDTTITSTVSHPNGTAIVIDPTGTTPEYRTVNGAPTGVGPYVLTLSAPLTAAHTTSAFVTDMPAKTVNRDPAAWTSGQVPTGLRWRMGASPNDATVAKASNTDVFKTLLDSVGAGVLESGVWTHPGGHLETSAHRPPDAMAFLARSAA